MNKSMSTDRLQDGGHPTEEEIFLYVDGELPAKSASQLRAHLDACWSCRVNTEKIQEAISAFVDYRNQILKPLIPEPPGNWRDFDRKLKALVAESGKMSLRSSVLSLLRMSYSALASTVRRYLSAVALVRLATSLVVALL